MSVVFIACKNKTTKFANSYKQTKDKRYLKGQRHKECTKQVIFFGLQALFPYRALWTMLISKNVKSLSNVYFITTQRVVFKRDYKLSSRIIRNSDKPKMAVSKERNKK